MTAFRLAAAALLATLAAALAGTAAPADREVTLRAAAGASPSSSSSSSTAAAAPASRAGRAAFAPNDPLLEQQWSLEQTEATAGWAVTTGSEGVVVAVLDTGVDAAHPDLQGKLVPGHDFVNDDDVPNDDNWHGTAVAGVVGAASNNGLGVASYCWQCRIMPVKVLDERGGGDEATVAEGIRWAVDHGARVVNVSATTYADSPPLARAVRYALRRGVVVVAAAGNDGGTDTTYPAAYPGVIGVSATTASGRLASWTNRGPHAPVAAPGTNQTTLRGGGYWAFQGSSSAAPVVSGIAALALSLRPDLSPSQVRALIVSSATRVPSASARQVNVARALTLLEQQAAPK